MTRVNLEEVRLNRGLSLRQAAEQIGIHRRTLDRAERGDSVHPGNAKLIADFYGVRVTDIWPVEPRLLA
jgi:lambda repressor-like predicted transcriptional regulator